MSDDVSPGSTETIIFCVLGALLCLFSVCRAVYRACCSSRYFAGDRALSLPITKANPFHPEGPDAPAPPQTSGTPPPAYNQAALPTFEDAPAVVRSIPISIPDSDPRAPLAPNWPKHHYGSV